MSRGVAVRHAIVLAAFVTILGAAPAGASLQVSPRTLVLERPEATEQLQVLAPKGPDRSLDLTRTVRYTSSNPRVATVSTAGRVEPRGEGRAEIRISHGKFLLKVPVEVKSLQQPAPISFERDVIPILTKAGCNGGSCHGKAEGKNGFKLSVFGFDPEADYGDITRRPPGRRINPVRPGASLLLQKAVAQVPHAGGKRFDEKSSSYRLLARWIAEGARLTEAAPLTRIEISPRRQTLGPKGVQQIRVIAVDADGRKRCVTAEAEYESNAGVIAEVDREGWVQASGIPGEAAVLVRYQGQVAVCRITVPQPGVAFRRPAETNFIDTLVWNKLQHLGIPPSEPASDAEFLRRAYLDTIGTLPTAAETRAFLQECDAERQAGAANNAQGGEGTGSKGKSNNAQPLPTPTPNGSTAPIQPAPALKTRARLIDQLLNRPEYADYWAMRWADLLRVDKEVVGHQATVAFTRWLRRQFAENRPYDQFAREILTARGELTTEGPAALYRVLEKPEEASRSLSQLFLGVRIECAQCHHHPSERWGQDDYFAFAGFFTGIARKKVPGGGEAIVVKNGTNLKHPRSGEEVPVRALGAPAAEVAAGADRRVALADWLLSPENPYFARVIANRLWAHYFGRGLVEPIDDFRATNPAVNEPLLDALAKHLRELNYDLKAFTRTLLTSQVYALSTRTHPQNANDAQNFSHASYRALPAEVLLDAICQATGIPEQFSGWPTGYRAIQVWDNRIPSYFFRIFGKPVRASVCECERSSEPSIAQALHLMNSPEIDAKIRAREGTARRLAESDLSPDRIIEELFLGTLSRFPTLKEREAMTTIFQEAGNRRAGTEDVLWALLNSREFVFNH